MDTANLKNIQILKKTSVVLNKSQFYSHLCLVTKPMRLVDNESNQQYKKQNP